MSGGSFGTGGGGGGALDPDAVWDAIGTALDDDPTRAPGLAEALVSAPVASTTQTGSGTGWTSTNGNGTATSGTNYAVAYAAGSAAQVEPTTSHPRHVRPLALDPLHGRWRVTARIASAPNDGNYRLSLAVGATALSSGVTAVVRGDTADVSLGSWSGGSWGGIGSGASVPVDGTGWVRLTGAGSRVVLECGTGTPTAEPSSWTTVADGPLPAAFVAQAVVAYLTRWGGANDLGGAFDDVKIEGFA